MNELPSIIPVVIYRAVAIIIFRLILIYPCEAQQIPDTAFRYSIRQSAFAKGEGPVVFIDAAHHNFHTRAAGYLPFSKLIEDDGYLVKSLDKSIDAVDVLKECKILVIVNPLNEVNADNWALPTPSAFSEKEINILKHWVERGGRLFLVADHMPFAGAMTALGKAFGFEFLNGFAITGENSWPPSVFTRRNGTLQDSPITTGLKNYERIDSVATFTGSAFRAPDGAVRVLNFLEEHYCLQPDTAWHFKANTPKRSLKGYQQGAVLTFGKGRVAVFGEAAMFTAQIVNGTAHVGFNSETAPQNAQFTLNLIHWLDGVKDYKGAVKK
jgi:hypothetical protein